MRTLSCHTQCFNSEPSSVFLPEPLLVCATYWSTTLVVDWDAPIFKLKHIWINSPGQLTRLQNLEVNWSDKGDIQVMYCWCASRYSWETLYVILPGKPSKSVPTYLKFSHFKHHIRLSFEQVAPFRLTIPLNLIQVEQKHFGKQWLYCLLYTLKFIVKLNLGNEEFIKITICLWFINGWSTDFNI